MRSEKSSTLFWQVARTFGLFAGMRRFKQVVSHDSGGELFDGVVGAGFGDNFLSLAFVLDTWVACSLTVLVYIPTSEGVLTVLKIRVGGGRQL